MRRRLLMLVLLALGLTACRLSTAAADREVAAAIARRQQEALHQRRPVPPRQLSRETVQAGRSAYVANPTPSPTTLPAGFEPPATDPSAGPAAALGQSVAGQAAPPRMDSGGAGASSDEPVYVELTREPAPVRAAVFTLSDAIFYAQEHRRELQAAKEDLYLAALDLTLERHLWTPQYAAELRSVYGNYNEIRNFDQAMRFVAALQVAQRLPYGGEFTARTVSTLIRDVGRSLTASESGQAVVGLNVPLLRRAGHVAQENLIRLERELTYAVRAYERFRRRQIVEIAEQYFDLLRTKQQVLDNKATLARFLLDFARAQDLAEAGTRSLLDTKRVEQQMLNAANSVELSQESFRFGADQFKIFIGMPVDEPLGMSDLESIESIEQQVAAGVFPLLIPTAAVQDESLAIETARVNRLELLTAENLVDDARRGVAISRNALLPDLDWNTTLTFDTPEDRYSSLRYSYGRSTWRSELLLSLPLERTRERNALRRALIGVNAALRNAQQQGERVRAEVRAAINQLRLNDATLAIQLRNVEVAELRADYARLQYYDGDIDNRDLVEAENDLTLARNQLNLAKTQRWVALLRFRLSTESLRIPDDPPADDSADYSAGATR